MLRPVWNSVLGPGWGGAPQGVAGGRPAVLLSRHAACSWSAFSAQRRGRCGSSLMSVPLPPTWSI